MFVVFVIVMVFVPGVPECAAIFSIFLFFGMACFAGFFRPKVGQHLLALLKAR